MIVLLVIGRSSFQISACNFVILTKDFEVFHGVCRIVFQIVWQLHPFSFDPIDYSLILLSYITTQSELITVLLKYHKLIILQLFNCLALHFIFVFFFFIFTLSHLSTCLWPVKFPRKYIRFELLLFYYYCYSWQYT